MHDNRHRRHVAADYDPVSVVWVLDARQKRINRQLAIAMPASPTASNAPSLRRQQTHTRWQSVQRLLKYDSGVVYDIRPLYVVCAGIVAHWLTFMPVVLLGCPWLTLSQVPS